MTIDIVKLPIKLYPNLHLGINAFITGKDIYVKGCFVSIDIFSLRIQKHGYTLRLKI